MNVKTKETLESYFNFKRENPCVSGVFPLFMVSDKDLNIKNSPKVEAKRELTISYYISHQSDS